MTKTSTARKPTTSKAKLPTIESVRAYTADVLSGFTSPLTRYEAGFQSSFDEFGNVLHPAGYHRHRSRSEIIAGLRKRPTRTSSANVQSIEAVRRYIDDNFALTKKDPPDDRFLYGYEDVYWLLWSLVDPMRYGAATVHLPERERYI
jgi:hypothetical protein